MEDTYLHKGLRQQLVSNLQTKGISDEGVLKAIGQLPRHFFFESSFEKWAYQDEAFPIACEQTISQPYTVAFQSSLLEVVKRQHVLEIGTGSGYQACILALMGARVFTVERHKPLYLEAGKMFQKLGLDRIRTYYGDGYKGLAEMAPFDRIIVTAAAPAVPQALKDQLKVGGILVIPVGEKEQRMLKITRLSETDWQEEDHGIFRFVPFLTGRV